MNIRRKISMMKKTGNWRGYLRTASGYPATLYNTMRDRPKNITVYGADGGVGDKTGNLCYPSADMPFTQGSVGFSCDGNIYTINDAHTVTISRSFAYVNAEPDTTYTVQIIPLDGYTMPPIMVWDITNRAAISAPSTGQIRTIKTAANTNSFSVSYNTMSISLPDPEYKFKIMIVKGSYTTAIMPDYEPYGYKIPIATESDNENKVITLYTPQQLAAGDYLMCDIDNKTAECGDINITALQDWTQDTTLPASDELRISADTEIEPSIIEVKYYSKRKE